ncbi:diguanylate cyclase domain-containing protein [Clostridium thailandense]|uniref:diguanylate cyclase domain-containing protein n=1 Tax=Clostridium thailandense TaxID=2794346 RepID=UPI003989CB81
MSEINESLKNKMTIIEEELQILIYSINKSFGIVVITDNVFNIKYANRRFLNFVNRSFDDIRNENFGNLDCYYTFNDQYPSIIEHISSGTQWQGELQGNNKYGEFCWHMVKIDPIVDDDGKLFSILFNIEDITENRQTRNTIEYMAYHDLLTGLPKMCVVEKNFNFVSKKHDKFMAVFFIDLDRFKNINDSFGHEIGDKLLKSFSAEMKSIIGNKNIMCRNGGDEFVVLVMDRTKEKDIAKLADSIKNIALKSFCVESINFSITLSMGISIYPKDGREIHTLIRKADIAMYNVKNSGRNNFKFYYDSMK